MIPEMHSILFNHFTVSSTEEISSSQTGKSKVTSEELFIAAKILYLAKMHSLIIQSWKSFKETVKKSAEENNKDFEQLEIRENSEKAILLEGERRHSESFNESHEGKIIGRQASKFRFWQGAQHEDGRHLHIPV